MICRIPRPTHALLPVVFQGIIHFWAAITWKDNTQSKSSVNHGISYCSLLAASVPRLELPLCVHVFSAYVPLDSCRIVLGFLANRRGRCCGSKRRWSHMPEAESSILLRCVLSFTSAGGDTSGFSEYLSSILFFTAFVRFYVSVTSVSQSVTVPHCTNHTFATVCEWCVQSCPC